MAALGVMVGLLLLLLRLQQLVLLFFRPGEKELSREKSILPRFSLGEGGEGGGAMLVKAGGSLRGLLMLRGLPLLLMLCLLLLLPSA